MKRSRFSEEQIIAVLKEQEAGDQFSELLQVEVQVWRAGSVRCPAAAPAGAGEGAAEEAAGRFDARQRHAQGDQRKKF